MVIVAGQRQSRKDSLPAVLVLISGPARAGKTRAGRLLAAYLGADHFALSDQLKRMTHHHYGLADDMQADHYEDVKEIPSADFAGLSPRTAYIDYSENHLKPRYGDSYLGEQASRRVRSNLHRGKTTIVSGVGFLAEIRPLIATAGISGTLHVRILPRPSRHAAPVDSRSQLDLGRYGIEEMAITSPHAYTLAQAIRTRLHLMERDGHFAAAYRLARTGGDQTGVRS